MSELDILAFLDESNKPMRDAATGRVAPSLGHYVVAAAIVLRGESAAMRTELRSLVGSVGHELHYSALSTRRRTAALTGIAEIDGWEGQLYETRTPLPAHRPEQRTRARILTVALADLTNRRGVRLVTLETRASPKKGFTTLDLNDHAIWRSLLDRGLVPSGRAIAHDDKSEPLLWLADLLAGARSDYVCGAERRMFPLVAHRISRVTAVDG